MTEDDFLLKTCIMAMQEELRDTNDRNDCALSVEQVLGCAERAVRAAKALHAEVLANHLVTWDLP